MRKGLGKKNKKKTKIQKKYFLKWKKTGIITTGVILSFFLVFGLHHLLRGNHLPQNLVVGEIVVGGMNESEFFRTITTYQKQKNPIAVVYSEKEILLQIPEYSYQQFMNDTWKNLENENIGHNWIQHIYFDIRSIFMPISVSSAELSHKAFSDLDNNYLYDIYNLAPVYQGKVAYVNNEIIVEDSSSGVNISEDIFAKEIANIFFSKESSVFALPVKDINPKYDLEGIKALEERLVKLLALSRTISHDDFPQKKFILDSEGVKKLLTATYNFKADKFVIGFSTTQLDIIQETFRAEDAYVKITEDYYVEIKEGIPGVKIDTEELRDALRNNFNLEEDKNIILEKGEREQPQRSAEAFKKHNLKHVISEFTTYHGCCAERVENIHLIANLLDEKILAPGETLNINEFIGERTVEKGFKPAGSIFKGEIVDSVGGGISQFITTIHNAVYWGGYEIIEHKPHSIYFSRYPKGIEATINWPYVDYIFRNDTDSTIMIDTEFTDTSITVRILGDNADRVFIGDHRGRTWKNIVRTSPGARRVVSFVSAPYNYRDPLVRYVNDAAVARGEQLIQKTGGQGWSVVVERKVIENDEIIHYDKKPVHYLSDKDTVIRVHPCDNPSEFIPSCYSQ